MEIGYFAGDFSRARTRVRERHGGMTEDLLCSRRAWKRDRRKPKTRKNNRKNKEISKETPDKQERSNEHINEESERT